MSAPAQKPLPFPVKTTALILSSFSTIVKESFIPSIRS
jgi:hypothetical protein